MVSRLAGAEYLFEAKWQLSQPVMAAPASDLGICPHGLGSVFPEFGAAVTTPILSASPGADHQYLRQSSCGSLLCGFGLWEV